MSDSAYSEGLPATRRSEVARLSDAPRLRRVGWALIWLAALGCMPSQVPAREVSDVARDLNLATRFGRMDLAAEHTSDAHRQQFIHSRAEWGSNVRVVDVEVAQLQVPDSATAEVLVDVAWVRIDEGLLRSTRIRQDWQNPGGGWLLNAERRVAGDFGLLGEDVTVLRPELHDAHFPTKTIR